MVEVEDVFPLEVVAFLIVLMGVWITNGCRPLWADADPNVGMVLFIAGGGLLLVFGIFLAMLIAEAANYIQRKRKRR